MTVGEVIALLVTYCSDEYNCLMSATVWDIEVNDDFITVYPANSSSFTISKSILRGES